MPSQVYWIEEPAIMVVDYSGQVTVEDVRTVVRQCLGALHHNPVYFLVDFSAAVSVALEIVELSSLSQWIYHPNSRWFAYVKPNRLFASLMQVRHHDSFKAFEDRDEALAFLHHAVETSNEA